MASLWQKAAGAAGSGTARRPPASLDLSVLDDEETRAYHEMLARTAAKGSGLSPTPGKRRSVQWSQGVADNGGGAGPSSYGSRNNKFVDFEGFDDEEEDDDDDLLIENDPDEALEVRGAKSSFDHAKQAFGEEWAEDEIRMRWNVKDLATLSIAASVLSIFTTGVLPLVDHFIWYKYDSRMTELTVTYWVAALIIGILGIAAAHKRWPSLVSLHVTLGFMLGVCLATYSVSVYYNMETRCETMQAAFAGCGGCECSWTNTCTAQNLTEIRACRRCQAWPVEVCRNVLVGFGGGMTLTSVMGVLALIFISVPVTINMILLIRTENIQGEAFKSKIGLDVVQLEEQYERMLQGEEPTIRPSALDLLIERVKERGLHTLAGKAEAALKVLKAQMNPPKLSLKTVAKLARAPKMGLLVDQALRADAARYERMDDDVTGFSGADLEGDYDDVDTDATAYKTPKPNRGRGRSISGRSSDRYYAAATASPKAMGYIPTPSTKGSPASYKGKEPVTPGWSMSRFGRGDAVRGSHTGSSRPSDVGSDFDLDY